MKLSRWIWIGGTVIFIGSAVNHIPAGMVVGPLTQGWRGVELSGIQGTLWHGSVSDARVSVARHHLDLGTVTWTLSLPGLLLGKLGGDVQFGDNSAMALRGKGTLGLSLSGLYAKHLTVSVAADALNDVLPVPVSLLGRIQLTVKDFTQGASLCKTANGRISWSGAQGSWMAYSLDLDQVRGQWTCQADHLNLTVKQDAPTVKSDWQVSLTSQLYKVRGGFTPTSAFPDNLKSQLHWLPHPDHSGRYTFHDDGHW